MNEQGCRHFIFGSEWNTSDLNRMSHISEPDTPKTPDTPLKTGSPCRIIKLDTTRIPNQFTLDAWVSLLNALRLENERLFQLVDRTLNEDNLSR